MISQYNSFLYSGIRETALVENITPFISPCLRLIDIGCGDGHLLYNLHKNILQTSLFGLDMDFPKLLKLKEMCPSLNLIIGKIEDMPFKSAFFETVVCSEVLEHIPRYEHAISELKRISKAMLIITTPYNQKPIEMQCPHCKQTHFFDGHINRFNIQKWKKLARHHNLKIKRCYLFKTIYSYNSLTLKIPHKIRKLFDQLLIFFAPILKFTKPNYLLVSFKLKK